MGSGNKVIGEVHLADYKERVDFGQTIGEYVREVKGKPIEFIPTSKGIIHYDSKGQCHVVPSDPSAIKNELGMFLRDEYKNMQEHLSYITNLLINRTELKNKVRGVEAIWDEIENTAKISTYYDGFASGDELEEYSIINTEIIAHCGNAMSEEKFIRFDSPNKLPKSEFWAYKRQEDS